ncbi:MAG TPA: HAD family hydrolase [Candidatus Saccharimonadales bacterium]|nr:HAD family hydrolase [Candidatus Saccharimonadales bacterium]
MHATHHRHSVALEWLQQQASHRFAVFSDIDNTLVGTGTGFQEATNQIRSFTSDRRLPLFLITGLSLPRVMARIATGEIPLPEAISCGAGTEIWLRQQDGSWQKDKAYAQQVQDSGFHVSDITKKAEAFIRQYKENRVSFQASADMTPYKVSLHFFAPNKQAAEVALHAAHVFAPFSVLYCEEINFNSSLPRGAIQKKYCLDIVPATKADALRYMVDSFHIDGGIKAGDSGNDIAMLLQKDVLLPVLVGGHTEEVCQAICDTIAKKAAAKTLPDGRHIHIEEDGLLASKSLFQALCAWTATVGIPVGQPLAKPKVNPQTVLQ